MIIGGVDVLVDCAGRDASEEFRKAAHGISAQKMMRKYLLGSLIHYDQDQQKEVHVATAGYALPLQIDSSVNHNSLPHLSASL